MSKGSANPGSSAGSENASLARGELSRQVQEITGEHVELAYVDQGYTGQAAADRFGERCCNRLGVDIQTQET
jgi:hypothetical protein